MSLQIHQRQVCEEEFEALKRQREKRQQGLDSCEKSSTIVAVCPTEEVPGIETSLLLKGESQEVHLLQIDSTKTAICMLERCKVLHGLCKVMLTCTSASLHKPMFLTQLA